MYALMAGANLMAGMVSGRIGNGVNARELWNVYRTNAGENAGSENE